MANNMTMLDANQVTKSVYDEADNALRVNVVASTGGSSSVTVTNAAGAAAVNIQDGGNSITVDGTVAATQSGTWTVQPGNTANTTAWKVDGSAVTQPVSGAVTVSGTVAATQSGTWSVTESGYTLSEFVRNDYTGTSVTTAAYVQLIASTTNTYNEIQIMDTSGQTLKLATGAAAAEVDRIIIPPGGCFPIKFRIASGTRISIKAISATASVGEIDIQLLG